MKKFKKIKQIFDAIRREWKTKLRLVIRNEETHKERFSLALTPRKIFVISVCSVLLLFFLTILLIAFTPLRVYIPGYTNPNEIKQYRELAIKVDMIEKAAMINQDYLDHFYQVLNEEILPENEDIELLNQQIEEKQALSEDEKQVFAKANDIIQEEAEMIYKQIAEDQRQASMLIPIGQKADVNTVVLTPPAFGAIVSEFNLLEGRQGIIIKNRKEALVNSVADGVVIYSGFDSSDGYTVVIQHSGNMISIYKRNGQILKNTGRKVKAGEAIAKMGNSGTSTDETGLYFELWYNGVPVNPLHYIMVR
ncbi:M23 family metallopeptidase [Bacteroidales bacterium OttesenSCG-928-L19]|nr:M23 family metallopeptidase [Bacteroidales bacterium OttesenSCG-928-L19]